MLNENKKITSKSINIDNLNNLEKLQVTFKDIRTISIKTIICLLALFILIIFIDAKPAVNNYLTTAYLWLSIIGTSLLTILLPKVLYNNIFSFNNLFYDLNSKTSEDKIKKNKTVILSYELSDFFAIFIVSCVIIQGFFAFGYFRAEVNGNSMFPTLSNGQSLIVESTKKVDNFDIVVLYYDKSFNNDTDLANLEDGERLIKRLIGKGGDSLLIVNGRLYLNGDFIKEDYLDERWLKDISLEEYLGKGVILDDDTNEYIIEDGYYFVLGDNRLSSVDSEELGLFKEEQIIGKAIYRVNSLFDWEKLS